MSNNNQELFKDLNRLGLIISERTRLKIITLLKAQELPASKINQKLHLPQNIVSHHLMILRTNGALDQRHEGRFIYYSVNRKNLKALNDSLKELLR
jgi:ArsR family transcriptional regulator